MAGNIQKTGARLRVQLGSGIAFGPGKADLLEGIRDCGSIAGAGQRMGMSYKRAWLLVEALNSSFATPLVETSRGGSERGGATLTPAGVLALESYRRMETRTAAAIEADLAILKGLLSNQE